MICGIKTEIDKKAKIRELSDWRMSEWTKSSNPDIWAKVTEIMKNVEHNTLKSLGEAVKGREDLAVMLEGKKGKKNKPYQSRIDFKGADEDTRVPAPGQAESDIEEEAYSFDPQEEIADIFIELMGEESRELSPEFAEHTDKILKGYTKLAQDINMSDINFNKFMSTALETSGQAELSDTGDAIRIRWNTMSRLASQSEIFLHELSHVIAKDVFKKDIGLRGLTKDLRDSAIKQGVSYTAFLDGISDPSGIEVEIAKRKFDYVFRGELEEFYAYVVSNEGVYKAIENVTIDAPLVAKIKGMKLKGNGKENSMQKFMNALINAVNTAWAGMTGRGGKGSDVVARLATTVAKVAAEVDAEKRAIEEETMGGDQSMWKVAKAAGAKLDDKAKDLLTKKTEWLEKTKTKADAPLDKLGATLKKSSVMSGAIESEAAQYLVNTVLKDTTNMDVTSMYQVFRKSKGFVEKHTSEIRGAIQKIINNKYVGEDDRNPKVDKSTQKAVKAIVVDTDLAKVMTDSLVDTKSILENPTELQAQINELAGEIKKEIDVTGGPGRDFKSRMYQVNGLAHYMIHGQTIMNNQQMNASNIVAGFDVPFETNTRTGANGQKITPMTKAAQKRERALRSENIALVEKIDKLTTLVALKKSSKRDKMLVAKLIEKEPETVQETANMYNNYMVGLVKDSKVGAYNPIRKGYSKAEEGVIKYRLVPESEVEGQISVNMKLTDDQYAYSTLGKDKTGAATRVAGIKPYAIIGGIKYYMMTGREKGTGFSEGAIGLISNTAEGVTLSSLLRKNNELDGGDGRLTGKADADMKKMIAGLANTGKSPGFRLVAGSTMVPVYDHGGNIVDYRLQMTTVQKEMELDEGNDLGEVLSNTFSRSTKTELTKKYNKVVIDTILDHTAQGVEARPQDYVIVEEYTQEMRENGIKYEKRHERWENLPDYTKDYVFKKLDYKGISIHKDFVELMTGEKDITVGNLKIGSFDVSKNPKLKARLTALESYTRELLGHMKRVMILIDAGVVVGNIMSNATVAAIHGIDPIEYVKEMTLNWKLLNEYNDLSRQKAELEALAKTGKNVTSRIKSLEKQISEHEYDSLVKDGQFTPIAEDININAKPDGQLYGMMQDFIDGKGKYDIVDGDSEAVIAQKKAKIAKHDKLAGIINGLKNVLYIDKASKVGKLALKNTQYQDAMTRRVIQKKLNAKKAKKQGIKVEDLSKVELQDTLDYLDQLLVNYGYTMNRYWNYSEKVAGLLFLRYYFGQAKALASMTTRNPLGVALMEGGQAGTGMDVYDPFETYAGNPLDAMINRWMLDDTIPALISPNVGDIFSL